MRTAITLEEFVFTLDQDEDCSLVIIDYVTDRTIYRGWKSDLANFPNYQLFKNMFVQYFTISWRGVEIVIISELED